MLQNFGINGNNLSSDATAQAILTPNSKTGSASRNYYVYLDLTTNGITYSSNDSNNTLELMVQVYNSNNELVSLSGLGSETIVKKEIKNSIG